MTLIVATSVATRWLQNEGARGALEPGLQRDRLRPFSGHKEASAKARVAAGRSKKGKAGSWEEECEGGQRQRG